MEHQPENKFCLHSKPGMYLFIDTIIPNHARFSMKMILGFSQRQLIRFIELGGYTSIVENGLDRVDFGLEWTRMVSLMHAVCGVNRLVNEWTRLREQCVQCECELQQIISRVSLVLMGKCMNIVAPFGTVNVIFEDRIVSVSNNSSLRSVLGISADWSYKIDTLPLYYIDCSVPFYTVCSWIGSTTITICSVKKGTDAAIWFLPTAGSEMCASLLQLVWKCQQKPFKNINKFLEDFVIYSCRNLLVLETPLIRLIASHPELLSVECRLRYIQCFAHYSVAVCEDEVFTRGRQLALALTSKGNCTVDYDCDFITKMLKWEPIVSAEKQSFTDGFNTILPFHITTVFLNTPSAWMHALNCYR